MSLFNFLSNSFNRFFVKKFTQTLNQSSALPPLKTFILEPIITPSGIFESGTFTVDHTGLVSIDYLFDGGSYQGELAIFSLSGMESLTPGSHEFIQEAAHRALSDSILGHIVIADSGDGARFNVSSGENWNAGEYLGIKSFAMNPDSEFGMMLVPNGHIQQVFDNPALEGDLRPLFSMVTANPNGSFHMGQITDVTGNGSTFVMEDLRMDLGTDRDYNDMIFQVRGAIGKAASIDNHIDPQAIDWRDTDMGKVLLDYIKSYDNSVVHPTYPLISSEPPDIQQPLVGIIDSYGFSPNNPDLNYQQIIAGSDRIDNDLNPYVPVYYPDTGTYLTGIVQATQNNEIGINGINDNAQMWLGRAGNDNWADSLIEFVNVTKNSHQTAVIQLNLDLTHINIDGTVTTRYALTPIELHALDYARQNHVIVVVPAGDDGSVVSGLGQASQQFDNIVTVGSAHRITDDPSVPIAQAYTRTDYSNYGLSLDIVADGGTIADPITSTVGNSTGTMAGTTVAAAQVVGALSLLWANNPDLDYRQVIKILKNTATDLNTLGWDKYTGAGLLNPKAAVGFAKVSPPEQYIDLPIDSPTPPPGYRDYIVQPGDSLIGITKNELHLDDGWTEIVKPDGSNFSSPNDNLPVGTVIYLPIKREIGTGISVVTPPPAIPKMPPQLELHSDQSFYIQGEPVSLVGRGLAYDFNGASDVSKVELSLELLDGSTRHLKDFTGSDLKIDADGFIYFEYDLPLETLNKGVYTLKAIAYDQAGLTSDPILDSFAVISPPRFNPGNPSGFDPKIDPISYAIERAIDLTNYTTDQIADTRWWTVSLPPNLSSQAKDLAASIGATYSENQESHIPDTFVWEFPPDLTPAEVVLRLEQLPQLQFFYPVITYRLEFPQLIVNSPMFPDQWNLDNSGQTGGTSGADANVLPVWADYGITGRNVTIGIVDDGVQYIHPNLIPNYLAALSYDFTQDWQYSYPNNQNYPHADYSDLALVDPDLPASNNLGAKRLVITPPPEVFLKRAIVAKGKPRTPPPPPRPVFLRRAIVTKGKRVAIVPPRPVFLRRADDGGLDSDDIFFYQASMHGTSAAGVALASNNGGMVGVAPNASFANLKLIQDSVVDNQIADSFGYESDDIDIYNNSWKPDVPFAILPSAVSALEIGATSGRGGLGNIYVFASGNDAWDGDNINYNGLANSRHAIAVGAIDDNGKSAWYSTPGAAILVAAYSSSNDTDGRTVGITTTDLVGEKGFDTSSYTHEFGGTSAAAPLVSGVIALMLEANPNLTQRDVQHILIEAARHNDPSDAEWVTNGAGYDVNYKYGFGAVDAKAAVEAAISWNSVDPEVRISSPVKLVNKPIPDYDPALVVDPDHPENAPNNPLFISEPITIITITQDITVEWAEVMFDATHSSRGDLKVTLISPDGTESILAEPRYDAEDNYYKWVFTSNRNWGESSLGNWTLRVSDEIDGEVGTFNSWQLNLYGTAKPIPNNSWKKQLGTPSEDTSRHIAVDSDGNLYSVGYTLGSLDGNNLGSADAYLAKYDSLGSLQWKSQLGTANSDQAWGVAIDNGNNIYITGNTGFSVNAQGNSLGTNDAFIAKYDSNGNQLWNNLISSPYDDTARDITVDSAGNAYITGMTWGDLAGNSSGQGDTWVAKYDSQGNQVWIEQSGTSGIDFSLGIARDSEGNIYTAGYTDGAFDSNTNAGNTDVFISKYNQNGEKLWTQQLGTTASEGYFDNSYGLGGGLASFERRFGIATDNAGNVYISGLTAGSLDGNINAGGTDAFIAKYNKDGNKLWTQQLGTTGDDRSAAVAVDSNNNVYILGYTTGSLDGQQNLGGADTFVVKYDSNGNKLETKLFGTTADDVGGDIAIDHSDNIYFTGNTFGGLVGSNAGSIDAWISKNEFIQIPGTPQVTIVAADATASEGGNAGQFVVTRTGDTSQVLTVKFVITGNAGNGQDYTSIPGSITIPAGATSVTIPVIPKSDAVVEADEQITVRLASSTNYDVGSDSNASVTIQDYTGNSQYSPFTYVNPANGHIYILSQPDSWLGAQAQAQALGGNLVTVNNAAEQNWLVNTFGSQGFWIGLTDSEIYNTTEGNFKWVNGEPVTYTDWEAGNPSNTLWDAQGEDFVEMNRHNPSGMWNDITNSWWSQPGIIEVDPNQLTKPIVLIQASDNQAGEEGNAGQLVVSRIGDTTNPLTVKYSVAGNATNGTDYEQLSGTITIPAGAALVTIPIVPIADYQVEGTEKSIVNLTPDSAYTVSVQGTTTVDIANESPINLLYRQVLGRDADEGGLNYHTKLWQNGESIEQIRWEMAHDTLFGEAKDQITLMYQTLVGRAPLTAEISYWQDRLGVDTTLSQVREFLSSTVADSIGEFSNVQGQNNWYYGYYEGSLASDNFQQMTEVKYGDWWVDNADYWTTLNSIGGHPNSVVGGITPVNQFPVRRWVSEVDGNINISGILAKTDTNFNAASDGTIGRILVDGVEVWSQGISATDNVGVNYSINAAVHAGSVVDFVIDAKSNDHYDGTKFTATIATEPLTPQPTTSKIYTNPTTGHKYFLTAQDTWLGAEAQAQAAGGNLVTINDAAENAWLLQTFGNDGLWIGLTDSEIYGAKEGQYKWVNGQPVTYTNWYPGMPNNVLHNREGEDFVLSFGTGREWDDYPSDSSVLNPTWRSYGIVEIPSTPTATNLNSTQTYTEGVALNLTDIVVADSDGQATVTLTLSNPVAGSLTVGTSGSVTSNFNGTTGEWRASGAVANVNALLAGVQFVPAPNFNSNLTIATSVTDDIAAPVTGTITLHGTPVNFAPTVEIEPTRVQTRELGTAGWDVSTDVATDSNNNAYMVGWTVGNLDGNTNNGSNGELGHGDGYITKYDASGDKVWTKLLGSPAGDAINGVTTDSNGNVYVVGDTFGSLNGANKGGTDAFFAKYDASGNPIWTRQIGTMGNDVLNKVTTDGSGNFYAVGYTDVSDLLVKFDANGNIIWTRNLNSSLTSGWDVNFDPTTGSIYIVGTGYGSIDGQPSPGSSDAFVARYDANGNVVWARQLKTAGSDRLFAVDTDSNGNVYVSGDTSGTLNGNASAGNTDIFAAKFDSAGNQLWIRQFGTAGEDYAGNGGVIVDSNNNVLVTGHFQEIGHTGTWDGFMTEFDSNGNRANWTQSVATPSWDYLGQMAFDNNNNLYVAGGAHGSIDGQPYTGGYDAVLLKYQLTQTYTEDTALNLKDLVVRDADPEDAIAATLTLSNPSAGTLSTGTAGTVTSSFNAATGTWSVSGTAANVNALLAGVQFIPAQNFNGNLTVNASVTDGHSPAVTNTISLTGKAVNDAPIFEQSWTYFGEDINSTQNTTTPDTDDPQRLTSTPNSDSARNSFLANLSSLAVESFESFANDSTPRALTFGTETATISGNEKIRNLPSETYNGSFPTTGNKFLNSYGDNPFTITFDSPQSALGFSATDVGDVRGQLELTLHRVDGSNEEITVPHTVSNNNISGSAIFFGIVDTEKPFSSVTFKITRSTDGFGLDDIIIGQVKPDAVAPTIYPGTQTISQTYTEDTVLNLSNLVVSDRDPEDTVTVTLTLSDQAAGSLSVGTISAIASTYNSVTGVWTASGKVAEINSLLASVNFIPAVNFNSNLTISAAVSDGHSTATTKLINLIGIGVNDAPTLGAIAPLSGAFQNEPFTITYANLLASSNTQDVENTAIVFRIDAVQSGTLTKNGQPVIPGVTTLSAGEKLVWTPSTAGTQISAFSVSASDGTLTSATPITAKVNVANAIPDDHWSSRFINLDATNFADDINYNFNAPDAVKDLGVSSVSNDGIIRLQKSFGSPAPGIQDDYFAMQAETTVQLTAGQDYAIATRSDDGTKFLIRKQGEQDWTEVGDDWRDRSTVAPAKDIYFQVPESGNYDFQILYYEKTSGAAVDVTMQPATPISNQAWTTQLGTTASDRARGVAVDGAGNVYMTGFTTGNLSSTNAGSSDIWVSKYDDRGNLLWTRQLGTAKTDEPFDIAIDNAGNAYITGVTAGSLGSSNLGGTDALIFKYDSEGNLQWTKQLGTFADDAAMDIAVDNNGNAYITGYIEGSNPNSYGVIEDSFVAKYDSNGNQQWLQRLGTASQDIANGVAVDDAGSVYITGATGGTLAGNYKGGYSDAFLAKYDGNGSLIWTQQLGTSGVDNSTNVAVDRNNNIYITGYTTGSLQGINAGDIDTFVAKYNADGSLIWTQQLGSSAGDVASGITVDRAGTVYVAGYTSGTIDSATNLGGTDAFVTIFDSDGKKLATKQIGTSEYELASDITVDRTGNVYITGETFGSLGNINAGQQDAWLSKNFIQPIVTISATDATASESDGTDTGAFTISRTGSTGEALTVNYSTSGTASNGSDYSNLSSSITIPAGASSVTIPIAPIEDTTYEGSETVILSLTPSTGYLVGTGNSATVNVLDEIPADSWIQQLGVANSWDSDRGMAVDDLGNVYIAGHTQGSLDGNINAGGADPFLTKYDVSGNKIWTKQIGSTGWDYYNNVLVDSYGDIYTVGYDDASGNYLGGVSIAKWDDSGNQIWQRFYDTATQDFANGIATDNEGNIYIAGMSDYAWTDPTNGARAFVVKYDSNGNRTWTAKIDTVGQDQARSVTVDSDGNVYIAGITEGSLDGTNAGNTDVFVAKYDVSGNQVWLHQLGSAGSEGATSLKGVGSFSRNVNIAVDSDGSAYISGSTTGSLDGNISAGNNDAFVAKYDTNGNKLWTQQLGTTADDVAMGVTVDSDGKVYIAGQTNGNLDGKTNFGGTDAFLTVFDSNGNKLTTQMLGTSQDDNALNVAVDRSGNVYLSGDTAGSLGATQAGGKDFWVAKNSITTTDLGQIYTNPANGHRYLLTSTDTWVGAQMQAEALGGNLVTINDATEQAWLQSTFGSIKQHWIGLTDSEIYGATEGNFKWISGEPVNYTNWQSGEPNNTLFTPVGEDFSIINPDGTWNDSVNDPPAIVSTWPRFQGIVEIADNPTPNLILDGNFEAVDTSGGWATYTSVNLPNNFGWTLSNRIEIINNYWKGVSGTSNTDGLDQSVDIDYNHSISQIFATEPGKTYELNFYYAHNPDLNNTSSTGYVTVKGDNTLLSKTLTHDIPSSLGNMNFVKYTARFTADSNSTTLSFQGDVDNGGLGFVVDDVKVLPVNEINYPDFSSIDGLNLVGSAAQVGDKLRLTPKTGTQTTAVWNADKQPVADGFETTFQFQINDLVNGGADGLAFVIQNSSATAIGGSGGLIGYGRIANSLAIEFDTYQNVNDPNGNHISIQTRGTLQNNSSEAYSLGTNTTIPNLSDGNIHTVKIEYVAGNLQVFLDDMTAPALTVTVDLATKLNLDSGKAWVGFTSSTTPTRGNHDILNWTFSPENGNDAPTLGGIAPLSGATQNEPFVITYSNLLASADASDADGDTLHFQIEEVKDGSLTKNGQPVIAGVTTLSPNEELVWHPDNSGYQLPAFSVVVTDGIATSATPVDVKVSVAAATIPNAPQINQLGTANKDEARGMAVDILGNVYVAGQTFGSLDGNINASGSAANWSDPFLTKYDPTGNKIWTKQIGTSGYDYYNDVTVDGLGSVYTLGWGEPTITKWDSDGNQLWSQVVLGTWGFDWATGISSDADGNVYVAGTTEGATDGTNTNQFDAFITKYNSSGNKLWTQRLGTATTQDQARSVATDSMGNVYLAGVTNGSLDGNTNAGSTDIFVTKYDSNGNKLWTRQLGTAASEGILTISGSGNGGRNVNLTVDSTGNIYIAGTTEGSLDGNINAGGKDAFVVKYDAAGNKLWTRQLGTATNDNAWGITVDKDGIVYLAGDTAGSLDGKTNLGSTDAFIAEYDSSGNKLATQLLGTSLADTLTDVAVDQTGNVYLAGSTQGSLGNNQAGNGDAWVAKNSSTVI